MVAASSWLSNGDHVWRINFFHDVTMVQRYPEAITWNQDGWVGQLDHVASLENAANDATLIKVVVVARVFGADIDTHLDFDDFTLPSWQVFSGVVVADKVTRLIVGASSIFPSRTIRNEFGFLM